MKLFYFIAIPFRLKTVDEHGRERRTIADFVVDDGKAKFEYEGDKERRVTS